jgi:hypothetical protein
MRLFEVFQAQLGAAWQSPTASLAGSLQIRLLTRDTSPPPTPPLRGRRLSILVLGTGRRKRHCHCLSSYIRLCGGEVLLGAGACCLPSEPFAGLPRNATSIPGLAVCACRNLKGCSPPSLPCFFAPKISPSPAQTLKFPASPQGLPDARKLANIGFVHKHSSPRRVPRLCQAAPPKSSWRANSMSRLAAGELRRPETAVTCRWPCHSARVLASGCLCRRMSIRRTLLDRLHC